MNMKDYVKMVEVLKEELKGLVRQRTEKHKELHEAEKEVKATEGYKELQAQEKELEKQSDKLYEEKENIAIGIINQFIDGAIDRRVSPSYSKTYGRNVKPDVIAAIKNVFDWSKLSGGAVEEIVRRMIKHEIDENSRTSEIIEEQRKVADEANGVHKRLDKMVNLAKNDLQDEIGSLNIQIHDIENQIVLNSSKLPKKEMDSHLASMGLIDNFTNASAKKRRALEAYRYQCEKEYNRALIELKAIRREIDS